MELAQVLIDAIKQSATLINATAKRWPDRPIQLELSWMPQMGKLDLMIRTLDHLPSYRPKLPHPGSPPPAA